MKKALALTLAAAMALSLAACGGSSSSAAADSTPSADTGSEAAATGEIQDVTLTLWGGEEDQTMLQEMADAFAEENKDKVNLTVQVGVQSESNAKDTILTDVTAAADVYTFADDQINELVAAGALMAIPDEMGAADVAARNLPGSVEAATVDGKLYAYPATADNGYFMFYDKSVFTEEDVQSLDKMMEVAAAAGKKVSMELTSGWYLYSFFGGAGLELGLAEDGLNTVCNWNEDPGAAVAESIMAIAANDGFISQGDTDFVTGLQNGAVAAGVNGVWNAKVAEEAWGENYAATKLPTYTLNGEQVQMSSYAGFKLLGVNPHSDNVGWALLLADYITNEENQLKRFEVRGQGPSNINAAASEEVAASPAIAALAAQAEFAVPQRVGANYWANSESLGQVLSEGGNGADAQSIMDNAVAGITAPVTE